MYKPFAALAIITCLVSQAAAGTITPDSRWLYPHYLTFRPGHEQVADVNPPRFSWAYVPQVIPEGDEPRRNVAARSFTFQLSRDPDFTAPEHEIETPYNFYNALPPLEAGRWYWRVGYDVGASDEQWSPVRSFEIDEQTPKWDRSLINEAAERLAAQSRPRLGPDDGDWQTYHEQLQQREDTAFWLDWLEKTAQETVEAQWWEDFPDTDHQDEAEYSTLEFTEMAEMLTATLLHFRLTDDPRYDRAIEHLVTMAKWPRGGLASPEFHGTGVKWGTRISSFFAFVLEFYDDRLTPEQREQLLESIEWRLEATYFWRASWKTRDESRAWGHGIGLFARSHPYENVMWTIPTILLTAGDLEVSDRLTPLVLNYLLGVGSTFGADEAWNEGLPYSLAKAVQMGHAALITRMLLPELEVERNPMFQRLGQWFTHFHPMGIQQLSFGDYGRVAQRVPRQHQMFRILTPLVDDPSFRDRWQVFEQAYDDPRHNPQNLLPGRRMESAWIELLAVASADIPEPNRTDRTSAAFPTAGFVAANSQHPSDPDGYANGVGMLFQSRPRGGYSHSFRAENKFVWHGFGQVLASGGGGAAYKDLYSRHSMSHNLILIDGEGQEWDEWRPRSPFVGRLLAYKEGDGYTHWVGDATNAYQTVSGLRRWHRHVVFVDERWFVVFDDVAAEEGTEPRRFSWGWHIDHEDIDLEFTEEPDGWRYRVEDVDARVAQRRAGEIDFSHFEDWDRFINPITGESMREETDERLRQYGRPLEGRMPMGHTLWVTNQEPRHDWHLLTALLAWPDERDEPDVQFVSDFALQIEAPDMPARTISFAPDEVDGDVNIDLDRIRRHGERTDPNRLSASGEEERVAVDDDVYEVEWLTRESFNRSDWHLRWMMEGASLVRATDQGVLRVQAQEGSQRNDSVVWYRPELPENVVVRFRTSPAGTDGVQPGNTGVFLHARENDGTLRFDRTGHIREYREIPSYAIMFGDDVEPRHSRVYRNPGSNAISDQLQSSSGSQTREHLFTFIDGRLRYYIDGEKVHDVQDDDPLEAGRLGLRTWGGDVDWESIEIGRPIVP